MLAGITRSMLHSCSRIVGFGLSSTLRGIMPFRLRPWFSWHFGCSPGVCSSFTCWRWPLQSGGTYSCIANIMFVEYGLSASSGSAKSGACTLFTTRGLGEITRLLNMYGIDCLAHLTPPNYRPALDAAVASCLDSGGH